MTYQGITLNTTTGATAVVKMVSGFYDNGDDFKDPPNTKDVNSMARTGIMATQRSSLQTWTSPHILIVTNGWTGCRAGYVLYEKS